MWQTFLNAAGSVLVIVLLTAVGYFCSAMKWTTPAVKRSLSKLLVNIAMPCMAVAGLRGNLSRELLLNAGPYLLAAALSIVPLYPLSYIIGKRMKLGVREVPLFAMICTSSNAMFVGYPMCTQLFGEASIPYVTFFYIITTTMTQSFCIGMVRRADEGDTSLGSIFKNIVRVPALWGVVAGLLLVYFDLTPPALLMKPIQYINNLVSPLALLVTGIVIEEVGLKRMLPDRITGIVLIFRFVLGFLLCQLMTGLIGIGGLGRDVFLVEATMPCQTQGPVVAVTYGADEQMAARAVAVSTVACFLVTPLIMMLISVI